ncbi:MAG: SulP family inorganic anion transporter [Deltaproteobacteria bacterium]|nr:SulP family inorganic anion transporter [Deltaproteobacteria bacterium]
MATPDSGWARNAASGFVVFLIALPLCLGIAMASGFPPVAGVLTAVVGGILGLPLGSARLTIKGPAAGLIVIAIGAVTELGGGDMLLGYRRALAVGAVAAVIQIGLALGKTGKFATVMPPAVVHGMLAAIGVIIVAKQAPVLLGAPTHGGGPLAMLADVPYEIGHANPYVAGIGLLSMALLLAWPHLPVPRLRSLPAPMVVLLLAVPLASAAHFAAPHVYHFANHDYALGPDLLVSLPGKIASAITFPDFSALSTAVAWKYVAMFALVGAVESLLSVVAVDAMDPEKRASNLDRDLLATGVANLVVALIGGLPMISEIVRSKANVDAGATDARSNFFHGVYLLLFVALLPGILHLIPLTALGAMLVVVGFRLASPREFAHSWTLGVDQFAVFTTTFLVTLATDLLLGVASGLLLKALLHVARGVRPADLRSDALVVEQKGETARVHVRGAAVFLNLLQLQARLQALHDAGAKRVDVDVHDARLVDHTALLRLEQIAAEWPDCTLEVVGKDALRAVGKGAQCCHVHT